MLLPVHLLAIVSPQQIFDRSVAAFKARKAFSVGIALDAKLENVVTTGRYSLQFSPPSKVLLTKIVNGKPNLVFWLNGNKFVAYDPLSKEMAVRKAPLTGPIVNRMANAVGGIEDPVAAQLSPETMAAFLSPFRALPGWTTSQKGSIVTLTRAGTVNGKRTLTTFDFSATSKLLIRAQLLGPTSKLQWVFDYRPAPKNLAFMPPAGTQTVASLSEHAEINATDPKARAIVDASLRAYTRIRSIAFTASGTEGSTSNWMSAGSAFRAKQAGVEWCYAGGVLTLRDSHGKAYRGPCTPAGVLTVLKRLNAPMEPMLQSLLLGRNPISRWFTPTTVVTARGVVTIKGVAADAVELRSGPLSISLLIRRDTHLVASLSSRMRDERGNVLSEAARDFAYGSVNHPIPPETFKLSVTAPQPLPSLTKSP